jgi:hypothetical protein
MPRIVAAQAAAVEVVAAEAAVVAVAAVRGSFREE